VQAEKLADSKGNGDHSSSGSGSECDGVILLGTTNEIESPTRKSLHIETHKEFFTASPPMGPLLIKPAEMMLFYTGADNVDPRFRGGDECHYFPHCGRAARPMDTQDGLNRI